MLVQPLLLLLLSAVIRCACPAASLGLQPSSDQQSMSSNWSSEWVPSECHLKPSSPYSAEQANDVRGAIDIVHYNGKEIEHKLDSKLEGYK